MENHRRLVCFDLDGTLIDGTVYIWQTLYETYVKDESLKKKITEDYYAKRITYEEWFLHDLEIFRDHGVTEEKMRASIRSLKLMKGARETLDELLSRGYKLALISGSLSMVLDELFPDHPFSDVLINEVYFDDHGVISGGKATPYDVEKKGEGLKVIASREGIPLDRCFFVGDNENDLSIAETAGFSIAFNCKSERLARVCNVVIYEKDLRKILTVIP
ncbi:MAG: HAD family phosphatase [Candidatus Eremiobacteraeota bacterium]|nr:HAD family phosphatase [Candidatus Eremiobacteraeota bacterium]